MAGGSLLALLDDIASVLDDVALLTKVAAKKTSGVLGDDLAVNAQQVTGVNADRELPVVWAVAKGSLKNKAILVPAALAISAWLPWLVTPLLMVGGAYLCFEGVEKIAHSLHKTPEAAPELETTPLVDPKELENAKIQGAIRTDFILSAEIIAITLGSVAQSAFMTRLMVLSAIGLIMTIGVYGVVAAIVKLDDTGLYLVEKYPTGPLRHAGVGLLKAAPLLMKFLGIAGTLAMFLVGGGIITHGIGPLHHGIQKAGHIPGLPTLLDGLIGMLVGGLCLAGWTLVQRIRASRTKG